MPRIWKTDPADRRRIWKASVIRYPEPKPEPFNWDPSETRVLSRERCALCLGNGLDAKRQPCGCVLRCIFAACYRRFLEASGARGRSCVSSQVEIRREPGNTWGHRDQEYSADFCLIARRTLAPADGRLFTLHFVMGADYRLCCARLHTDKGRFFHSVYRIQQLLGRAYRETRPYPLFPLDEYFSGRPAVPIARLKTLETATWHVPPRLTDAA